MGLDPVSSGTSSSQIRSAMCHVPCFGGDALPSVEKLGAGLGTGLVTDTD